MSQERDFISIQQQDFDHAELFSWLKQNNPKDGAIVTFVGLVRDMNLGNNVKGLHLEHYPKMTENALVNIIAQARQRWPIGRVCVVHRVGELNINDNIVFVGVTSKHRLASFQASEFIMDFLKTQVPIWKKEFTKQGDYWVPSKEDNQQAEQKWADKLKGNQ